MDCRRKSLFALGAALLIGSTAAAGELPPVSGARPGPTAAGPAPAGAPVRGSWRAWLPLPRFRWGLPDSRSAVVEAERHLLGFHLRFDFGRRAARPRAVRLR